MCLGAACAFLLPRAIDWIMGVATTIWCLVETHQWAVALRDLVARMRAASLEAHILEPHASATSEVGCYGGGLLGVQQHLRRAVLPTAEPRHAAWVYGGPQVVGVQVQLAQQVSELMLFAYHRGSLCDQVMPGAVRLTRGGRVSFCMLADWNVPPSTLSASMWLVALRARVVAPANVQTACWSSPQGSLLDFAWISEQLCPHVLLNVIEAVPWSPHSGLHLSLWARPAAWRIQTLALPSPLPAPVHRALTQEQAEQRAQLTEWELARSHAEVGCEDTWHRACESGGSLFWHQKGATQSFGTAEAADAAGLELFRWFRTWEQWALERGEVPLEPREGRAACGRGDPVRLLLKSPIPPRPRLPMGSQRLATEPLAARVVASVFTLARRLSPPLQEGEAVAPRACRSAWNLLDLLSDPVPAVAHGLWIMEEGRAIVAAMVARAASLVGRQAKGDPIDPGGLVAELESQQRQLAKGLFRTKQAAWRDRDRSMLLRGAGSAHQWANLPNTLVEDPYLFTHALDPQLLFFFLLRARARRRCGKASGRRGTT